MRIKKFISSAVIAIILAGGVASVIPAPQVHASSSAITSMGAALSKQAACSGLNQVDGGTAQDCSTLSGGSEGITRIASAIVEILSLIVGVLAVIMIIIAGFKFITAGGDSGRVSSAKSTLIYALVGLAIAALAQFLVNFTLSTASPEVCPTNSNILATDSGCQP